MKPTHAITAVTATMLKDSLPEFGVGDTVRVSVKVVEGTRERTQVFEGVVMRKRGGGINESFTVRRIASHGIGVERTFMLNSPRVEKIDVVRFGVVRRAQLYYLRGLTGKAARIKERRYRPGVDDAKGKAAAASASLIAPIAEAASADAVDEVEEVEEVDAEDVADVDGDSVDVDEAEETDTADEQDETARPTT